MIPPASSILLMISLTLVAMACLAGPLPYAARAILYAGAGPVSARRWWRAVAWGLSGGMLAAVWASEAWVIANPLVMAVYAIVILLAIMDLRWRWLPIEWTTLICIAAFVYGLGQSTLADTIPAMLLPAGVLAVIRWSVLQLKGVEIMGIGDLWLIAGLSGFLGLFGSILLIGCAATTGLLLHATLLVVRGKSAARYGVAFGTHLCVNFLPLSVYYTST